jgi:hypothetical protein
MGARLRRDAAANNKQRVVLASPLTLGARVNAEIQKVAVIMHKTVLPLGHGQRADAQAVEPADVAASVQHL